MAYALVHGEEQTIAFTTKRFMSLRSPTENENEGMSLHMIVAPNRHSRAGGNPGLFSAELA